MRTAIITSTILSAAVALAAPANATVFGDFLQGVKVTDLAGFNVVNTFDTSAGITGGGFNLQSNSNGNGAIIPLSDSQGTSYLTVRGGGSASIDLGNVRAFAFEWGSLDTYNKLTINLVGGGSFDVVPGTISLPNSPGNGDQMAAFTNGTFRVTANAGERFQSITLSSSGNSFEADNLALAAVPEPASWAMMILGLGAVGFVMRRQRQQATVRFA